MTANFRVGVLGATGAVGQRYLQLLENHPWFTVTGLAASSEHKTLKDALNERGTPLFAPACYHDMPVHNAQEVSFPCDFVFSALDSKPAKTLEPVYANLGIPVVSNASAYRDHPQVPMVIPEINADHIDIINNQPFKPGLIAVKPNCSIQSFLLPLHALELAGYRIERLIVHTQQAISGAGRGLPAADIIDNVNYIAGEQAKTENEPNKIFGTLQDGSIVPREDLIISATCTRVPVLDGHLASVHVGFKKKAPSLDEVIEIWQSYQPEQEIRDLASAPKQALIYRPEADRPQPRLDRVNDMAVTVGQLQECPLLDIKFVGLSHNTVRGAAGGGILIAELLAARGYL